MFLAMDDKLQLRVKYREGITPIKINKHDEENNKSGLLYT